jgi:thiol-disulfide isomerase/thioredoxin
MTSTPSVVTPERFASGMTFAQYLAFIGSPENLAREGTRGEPRRDWTPHLRAWYEASRLSDAQAAAVRWLAAQPGGPAKVLVISEEWSSDCRRDVPMLARLAEAGGLELRIVTRDGKRFGQSQRPSLAETPDSNADIMAEFLNVKNGQTWQSIPVAVFYTKDLAYLYHYVEYPAIYHKDRLVNEHIRAARPGETPARTRERGDREFTALQQSPFFRIWACAGVDEILSALHERLTLGSLA